MPASVTCEADPRKDRVDPRVWRYLFSGAILEGFQKDNLSHSVRVEIIKVEPAKSTLCGYLEVSDLNPRLPVLRTYFEGEIIGPHFSFRTQHPSWGAEWDDDLEYWQLLDAFHGDSVAMRWKECFPLPEPTKPLLGASYAGFYYLCINVEGSPRGQIQGYYFQKGMNEKQVMLLRPEMGPPKTTYEIL